jgi:hypothetical protein
VKTLVGGDGGASGAAPTAVASITALLVAVGFADGGFALYRITTAACVRRWNAPTAHGAAAVSSKKSAAKVHAVRALLPLSGNRLVVAAGPFVRVYSYEEASSEPDFEVDVTGGAVAALGGAASVTCLCACSGGSRVAAGVQGGAKPGIRVCCPLPFLSPIPCERG